MAERPKTTDLKPFYVEQKASQRLMKESLPGNFPNSIVASRELIDNALGNRIPGRLMIITFRVQKNQITVHNVGGVGMGKKEIELFFHWGETTFDGISFGGQGGKAACLYFGEDAKMHATREGETIEYEVNLLGWGDPDLDLEENVLVTPRVQQNMPFGKVQIIIKKLRPDNIPRLADLRRDAADVYRSVLKGFRAERKNRKVRYTESDPIEIQIGTFRQLTKIEPLQIPLIEGEENIQLVYTEPDSKDDFQIEPEPILFWVGKMIPDSGVSGGIRCVLKGRKICDREFFGHPTYLKHPALSSLIGEVHLDFVEGLTPILNKTDFNRGSRAWKRVQKVMYAVLAPHVEELISRKDEPIVIHRHLQTAHKDVKRAIELAVVETGLEKALGVKISGRSHGQKRPEKKEEVTQEPIGQKKGGYKQEGKTIPDEKADTTIKRKRRGIFHAITAGNFGAENPRAAVITDENGRMILKLNVLDPRFRVAIQNEIAYRLYLADTAAKIVAQMIVAKKDALFKEVDNLHEKLYQTAAVLLEKGPAPPSPKKEKKKKKKKKK